LKKTHSKPNKSFCPVEFAIKLNIHEVFSLSGTPLEVLNVILEYDNNFSEIYVSEETISKKIKRSVRQVIRAIQKLVSLGAITVRKNSGWNPTNNYKVNKLFYIPEIRSSLSKIYSSLVQWGINSYRRAERYLKKNVTLYICSYNLINAFSEKIREWTAKDDIEFLQQRKLERSLPVNVLARINQSIFKRLAEIHAKEWFARSQKAKELLGNIAAAPVSRYKPTQEQLSRLIKKESASLTNLKVEQTA
jgi:predicted transcriptional regulator